MKPNRNDLQKKYKYVLSSVPHNDLLPETIVARGTIVGELTDSIIKKLIAILRTRHCKTDDVYSLEIGNKTFTFGSCEVRK